MKYISPDKNMLSAAMMTARARGSSGLAEKPIRAISRVRNPRIVASAEGSSATPSKDDQNPVQRHGFRLPVMAIGQPPFGQLPSCMVRFQAWLAEQSAKTAELRENVAKLGLSAILAYGMHWGPLTVLPLPTLSRMNRALRHRSCRHVRRPDVHHGICHQLPDVRGPDRHQSDHQCQGGRCNHGEAHEPSPPLARRVPRDASGPEARRQTLAKIAMWAGNNVTRPFRVAGAAAVAPFISKVTMAAGRRCLPDS